MPVVSVVTLHQSAVWPAMVQPLYFLPRYRNGNTQAEFRCWSKSEMWIHKKENKILAMGFEGLTLDFDPHKRK